MQIERQGQVIAQRFYGGMKLGVVVNVNMTRATWEAWADEAEKAWLATQQSDPLVKDVWFA